MRISPTTVDITDLAAVKRIHSTKDGFLKDPFYSKLITDSDSVFNTIYPANHRKYKRLLSAPMSETGLKAFLPQIDGKVRLALERIREENKTRGAADLAKWFMFLSFDIVGELTFGESFGNLKRGTVSGNYSLLFTNYSCLTPSLSNQLCYWQHIILLTERDE